MKSELNSFDSNIQIFLESGFEGIYEPVKNNKYLIINIYTDTNDELIIYFSDNPLYNLIKNTYKITKGSTILTIEIKSRFMKVSILTNEIKTLKRIYDVNLVESINNLNKNEFLLFNNEIIDGIYNASYYSEICNTFSQNISNISIYGTCSTKGRLVLQYSNDGKIFYNTQYSYDL
jgi:hypothetical protein